MHRPVITACVSVGQIAGIAARGEPADPHKITGIMLRPVHGIAADLIRRAGIARPSHRAGVGRPISTIPGIMPPTDHGICADRITCRSRHHGRGRHHAQ
jgi:hypothetical protein